MLRLHASIQMLHVCEQWEPSYLGGYTSVVTLPLYSRNISSNHRAPTLAYTTVQGDSLILSISLITLEAVVRLSLGTHICACIIMLCQSHCMRVFMHERCNAGDYALMKICVNASFTVQLLQRLTLRCRLSDTTYQELLRHLNAFAAVRGSDSALFSALV